jgi:hypothetical protein
VLTSLRRSAGQSKHLIIVQMRSLPVAAHGEAA